MDESNMTDLSAERHAEVEPNEPVEPLAMESPQDPEPEPALEFEEGVLGDQGPWVADDNEEDDDV